MRSDADVALMKTMGMVLLLSAFLTLAAVACGGAGGSRFSLGQQITVDAQNLPQLAGEAHLRGQITVTFERVTVADSYNDDICGGGNVTAKGKFVVVAYRVRNDAQARMQPATQLGDEFLLVDGRGRQWQGADSASDYCFIDANWAELFPGGEGPEHLIDPGFEGLTAVVFDVPNDAEQLTLQNSSLRFKVDLGL